MELTDKRLGRGRYKICQAFSFNLHMPILCRREIFDLSQNTSINSWLLLQENGQNLFGETIVEGGEVIMAYFKIVEAAKAAVVML